jgi:hypothetical protein
VLTGNKLQAKLFNHLAASYPTKYSTGSVAATIIVSIGGGASKYRHISKASPLLFLIPHVQKILCDYTEGLSNPLDILGCVFPLRLVAPDLKN